jgi:flagellar motor switch protein FliG
VNRGLDFKLDGTGSALRHCALLLHSMRLDDRDWILANLGSPRVNELQQLLGELKALGIPADRAAAQTALKQADIACASAAQAFPSPARAGSGTDWLHDASAAELAQVLEHEPAGLIAQALAMCASHQQRAILAHLKAPKRRQVQERIGLADASRGFTAPRSSQALLEQLAVQLGRMRLQARPARRPWLRLAALWKAQLSGLRSIFS